MTGKIIPVIRINIADNEELQAWAHDARAQHISLPEFAKAALLEKVQSAKKLVATVEAMGGDIQRIASMLNDLRSGGLIAVTATPFVSECAETAESLFDGTDKLGW